MTILMNVYSNNIAAMLAEDAGAPELRNPRNSAIRASSWLARLFRGLSH